MSSSTMPQNENTTPNDKQQNIDNYAKALQEIINDESPNLDYIIERLIPQKNGKNYIVKTKDGDKDLIGFDRIKTSFARRSWNKMDKQLKSLEEASKNAKKKPKKFRDELWKTENLFHQISIDAAKHKNSMMNGANIWEKIWTEGANCVAESVFKCFSETWKKVFEDIGSKEQRTSAYKRKELIARAVFKSRKK